jgi:hypothetical protein
MAKTIDQLLQQAKIGSANSFREDGTYNTGYKLSQEQIEVSALLQIDSNLEEARKKCYINGFSLRDGQNPVDIQELFNKGNVAFLDAAFNLTESINTAKSGKPAFFVVEDEGHYVTIALVPDTEDPQKITVQYINSITRPDPELTEKQAALMAELASIPENQRESEEAQILQVSIASISDTIAEQDKMSNVGKDFAKEMLKYLKKENIPLGRQSVLDRSNDQQLSNCCGLSVASNIAAITTNEPLFNPKNSNEKIDFYSDFGASAFSYIESGIPESQSKLSATPPPIEDISVVSQDIEKPKINAKIEIPKVDTPHTTQSSTLATQIAATIIENHDLFKDNAKISKSDFAQAINNSQSLDSVDRKSFNLLANKMDNKTYSKEELTKIIASSNFVKVQVAAVEQIRQIKISSLKESTSKPSLASKDKMTSLAR